MDRRRSRVWLSVITGFALTIAVSALLLGRSLGRGILLYRDFVTVPAPVASPQVWGWGSTAPRAVPLDGITAALAPVIPPGVQQQVLLVSSLLLAGAGVTVLLREHGPLATAVGAGLATWNPYATERLLLGQAPTLLAWSVLPWMLIAVRRPGSTPRRLVGVALAAAPAALTPFGGLIAGGAAIAGTVVFGKRSRRDILMLAGVAMIWCLPWLLPTVLGRAEAGQADGARAFALEVPGIRGVLDVIGGGGVWAPGATLASRATWVALLASVILVGLAVYAASRTRRRTILLAAVLGPLVLALALATPPGLAVFSAAQAIPGVAVFRDTHRWMGLSWLVVAILVGWSLPHLVARSTERFPLTAQRSMAVAAGLGCVALTVLSAPDAPTRLAAAYRPVQFPSSWDAAVGAVGDGRVLVLPWQPFRQVSWVGESPFLDPVGLAVRGDVVTSRRLTVERSGQVLHVGPPESTAAAQWATGTVDLAELHRLGVTRVFEWRGTPGSGVQTQAGLTLLFSSAEFRVWSVNP